MRNVPISRQITIFLLFFAEGWGRLSGEGGIVSSRTRTCHGIDIIDPFASPTAWFVRLIFRKCNFVLCFQPFPRFSIFLDDTFLVFSVLSFSDTQKYWQSKNKRQDDNHQRQRPNHVKNITYNRHSISKSRSLLPVNKAGILTAKGAKVSQGTQRGYDEKQTQSQQDMKF